MNGNEQRDASSILDPRVIARIQNLVVRARLIVEGLLSGLHSSSAFGSSIEFLEHKEYAPGDDLRRLDWKALAKSGRYYIKKFEEETNLRAFVVIDATSSMGYASSAASKLDHAVILAASLAYLMLHRRDSVGFASFGEGPSRFVPPSSSPDHLNILLREMARLEARGSRPVAGAIEEFASRLQRRGLVLVFSDLLDDAAELTAALRRLRKRKHEVAVFHVLDPAEVEFPFAGMTRFVDMERPREATCEASSIASSYRSMFSSHFDAVERDLRAAEIDFLRAESSTPPERTLLSYLERGGK